MKQMRCCGAVMPAVVSHLTCVVCPVAQASMDTSVQTAEQRVIARDLGALWGAASWVGDRQTAHPASGPNLSARSPPYGSANAGAGQGFRKWGHAPREGARPRRRLDRSERSVTLV